jgi:hypothetical protein
MEECERIPPPAVETLFEDVLHQPGPQLAEQRDRYLRMYHQRLQEKLPEVP